MIKIPDTHIDLLVDEMEAFATLATVMPDGSPQLTPVWFDFSDGKIRLNTAKGRVKEDNMRERPRVAFLVVDPKNPYRYIQIRGNVQQRMEEGAAEHIHRLADKYTGEREFRDYQHDQRVMYILEPESIDASG
jgi:PPOX class probable F420-dependent enzyme